MAEILQEGFSLILSYQKTFTEQQYFEIYFDEIHPSDKEISEQGSISFLYFDANDEAFSLQYPLESYVEQCEACEADPRMQVKGCENIDEGWIALKLQGEEA